MLSIDILLEFTPIAQYAIGMDHKITCWNKSCELLTGFSEKEMLGTDNQWKAFYDHKRPVLADLIVDDNYPEIQRLYKGKSKESTIVPAAWEATNFFPKCGNKPRYLYWMATPIFNDNSMVGVVTTLQDVTEQEYWEMFAERETNKLWQENLQLKSSIKDRFRFQNIIGNSPAMQEVYSMIIRSADSNVNFIIYGESGTGKEMVAQALYEMSSRVNKEFVPINCGAIPETLIESELFGYVKGAFTGATCDKQGYLDRAHGGILFLDEVCELDLNMQVKLLRALESGEYYPVGSSETRRAEFRVISATNKDLSLLVEKGLMRKDFFYRIHVIPINLPPLRDRKEDLPLLIDHILHKYGDRDNPPSPLPGKVIEAIYNYDWPGNIRELQNVLQRYLTLRSYDFIQTLQPQKTEINKSLFGPFEDYESDLKTAVKLFEGKYISEALERNRWRRCNTAASLQISRKTLFRKMREMGLS